jgi:adenylate cyclase
MAVGLRDDERERLDRGNVQNDAARTLYKQALDLVNPPNDVGRLLAARRAFERVIELDPSFAGGYAGTAYTSAFMVFWGRSESPDEDTRKAFELSEQALDLDPSFGLAYSARAFAYQSRREFDKALDASSTAIDMQPNDPYVSVYHAAVLLSSGEPGKGIDYAKRALRLDPLAPRTPYLNILGMANFHAGKYAEALDAFQRNIARGGPFGAHIQCYLTATYAHLGRIEEAHENFETLGMYKDAFDWKGWIQRWMKEPQESERLLAPLRKLTAKS